MVWSPSSKPSSAITPLPSPRPPSTITPLPSLNKGGTNERLWDVWPHNGRKLLPGLIMPPQYIFLDWGLARLSHNSCLYLAFCRLFLPFLSLRARAYRKQRSSTETDDTSSFCNSSLPYRMLTSPFVKTETEYLGSVSKAGILYDSLNSAMESLSKCG